VETNATRMCELLVGLPDVNVLAVDDRPDQLRVHVETRVPRPACQACGRGAEVKDRPVVELVDLACFGRPTRLVWHKRRWSCGNTGCLTGSWTETAPEIASARMAVTTRAGRWACEQVGRWGRSVNEVAVELGCAWHTVNDAVHAYGQPLVDDPDRFSATEAIGLDEMLLVRQGRWRTQHWVTAIVDVAGHQLLDLVPGRDQHAAAGWLLARGEQWLARVRWACLDLSGSYRATFDRVLPWAIQVADPFHVVRLANQALDECRRRVQNESLGHRGRKGDPLYRVRRRLSMAAERLDEAGTDRLVGLLAAGDPKGEVRMAWHAKETVRGIYDITDPVLAKQWVDEIIADFTDRDMPAEIRRLGRTIRRWRDQILAWHRCRYSNGPTEATNNLSKRVKRAAFGFRSFANFRIRALLYAGRPNWNLLPNITP